MLVITRRHVRRDNSKWVFQLLISSLLTPTPQGGAEVSARSAPAATPFLQV